MAEHLPGRRIPSVPSAEERPGLPGGGISADTSPAVTAASSLAAAPGCRRQPPPGRACSSGGHVCGNRTGFSVRGRTRTNRACPRQRADHDVRTRLHRRCAMTGADRTIRWSTAVAVIGVAVVAAVVSYEHAYLLVRAHGEGGWTAHLIPLTVDGLIWASSMVMLDSARRKAGVP